MSDIIQSTRNSIDRLLEADATSEDFLIAQAVLARVGEIYRELKEKVEAASIDFIERKGQVEDGEIRYYVGVNKTTKCKHLGLTCKALLDAVGGDVETMVTLLSTAAFKPGACREVLGDDWQKYFETEETKDLKTGAPSHKRLKKTNERFLK